MTLESAMEYCFKDKPCKVGSAANNTEKTENRKWFNNNEAADTYSESLKDLWSEGLGLVYGPFVNNKIVLDGNNTWWEVSYK